MNSFTNTPLLGYSIASPSSTSCLRASLTGLLLTLSCAASSFPEASVREENFRHRSLFSVSDIFDVSLSLLDVLQGAFEKSPLYFINHKLIIRLFGIKVKNIFL